MPSKEVTHSLNTDHIPTFDNIKILATGCKYYEASIFLEGWRKDAQSDSVNEGCAVAREYSISFVGNILNACISHFVTLLLY